MRRLGLVWLLLAAVGAVMPMLHFKAWADENGYSWSGLVEAWTVNAATTGMLWDLAIVGVTVSVATLAHVVARRDWPSLVCIPVSWGIGVSAGLPLFLWFLTRKPRESIKARDEN